MSNIDRQIRQAQRRLWLNRWLRQWGWTILFASVAWTLLWIANQLFALKLPMGWAALTGFGVSVAVSVFWLIATREPVMAAAVALDEAAGLRERLSTGLHAHTQTSDPFARAVVADAESRVAGLSAKKFLPVRWTGSLSLSSMMLAVALLSLLLPEFDILNSKKAAAGQPQQAQRLQAARAVLKKPVSVLEKITERNPDLGMEKDIDSLKNLLQHRPDVDPDALRRQTVKNLDNLQDALKKKAESDRYKALNETKKRLKQLGKPQDPKSELGKLIENLSAGDFDQAQQSIKALQEKLAKRAKGGGKDAAKLKELQKQLNDLAKQLEQAAEDKQSQRELQNAGLKEADAKRLLSNLSKKDPKQVEKAIKDLTERLKEKGMSEEQIKEMIEKIKQRQKACSNCQKMGNKMSGAAKECEKGNLGSASSQLGEAGEMLDELEQMESALNDVEAQLAELNDSWEDMSDLGNQQQEPCQHCQGTGFLEDGSPCPHCNGTGNAGSSGGRGSGNRARDDSALTDTVNAKAKVKQGRGGSIVGQQFVKGQPIKGQSLVELGEAAAAAELDASDALNKDRVPRRYRSGVKKYFDRLGDRFKKTGGEGTEDVGDSGKDANDAKEAGKDEGDAKESTEGDEKADADEAGEGN
ncbi:MAG: hypothetical protein ABII12_07540 [Planctomycetota bacterium]